MSTTPSTARALYLACVAPAGSLEGFACAGLDEKGGQAKAVRLAGFDAVVIEVDPGVFDQRHTEDIEWLAPRASRHEAIVRAARERTDVMPLGFGGVFSSERTLERTLETHRSSIEDFLTDAEGCDEWSVKAVVNRAEAIERARTRLAESMADQAGQAYLLRRKLDSEAVVEAERTVVEQMSAFVDALDDVIVGAIERPVVQSEAEDGRWTVVHVALLVPRNETDGFDRSIDEHAYELEQHGIDLEITGPWAPYSFVPVFEDGEA
ncbi:MAG: GvpL/GvpF family gas vesicle protein [Phycisphaerales bacterium]